MTATTNDFKVKLVSAIDQSVSGNRDLYASKVVVFDVSPAIVESGSVEYEPIQITQGPTSFQAYKGTPARTFSMSDIKLISRTPKEARDNIQRINLLRSWRMPYFGDPGSDDVKISEFFSQIQSQGAVQLSPFERLTAGTRSLRQRLGAPPEILYFSAYSAQTLDENGNKFLPQYKGNISRVPTVLTALTINYPNDVAYIPTSKRGAVDALGNVPFPVIMTISIELTESHSPSEASRFNLAKYANGVLEGF